MSITRLVNSRRASNSSIGSSGAIGYQFDSDAATYIRAVEAADANSLESGVRAAIHSFVVGCKADGTWSAIKASCILMGARTLSGALTPLVGSAPTNSNFVSGDYDRKLGLVGNASTKNLNSGRSNNADPQNSRHMAIYGTVGATGSRLHISTTTLNTSGDSYLFSGNSSNNNTVKLSQAGTPSDVSGTPWASGFYGATRSVSTSLVIRRQGADVTQTVSSVTPINENLLIFGVTGVMSNARIAFYSIGESLTLSQLDTRVTLLYQSIASSIA